MIAAVGHGLALSNSIAAVGHGLALSNSFGAFRSLAAQVLGGVRDYLVVDLELSKGEINENKKKS